MTFPLDTVLLYLLVYARALALLLAMPFFSWRAVPAQIRGGFALVLAVAVAPAVPAAALPSDLPGLVLALLQAVSIGLLMGLAMRFVFAAVEMAGHFMASEIGTAMPAGMDPSREAQSSPAGQWLSTLAMVIFFSTGLYRLCFDAFLRSFSLHPAGAESWASSSIAWIVQGGAAVFQIAVAMAAPLIAVNFLINLSFSILGKVVPRLNVFITSFSIRILAGLFILSGSTGLLTELLSDLFHQSVGLSLLALD